LQGDFYVDADMIRDAIARRASFNVVHLATMFKADIFVLHADAWSREEMKRACVERIAVNDQDVSNSLCIAGGHTVARTDLVQTRQRDF